MDTSPQNHRPVAEGPWDFYSYRYGEGERATITFNVRADAEPAHHGYSACRRVIIYFPPAHVYQNGLPTAEELHRSTEEERALIAALEQAGVDCIKVGHMLYGAMRDMVFQVNDTRGFAEVYQRWRAHLHDRNIDLIEKDGWSFFDERLRPKPADRKWIEHNRVVVQLLQAGSNPRAPHALDHTFTGEGGVLDTVAAELLDAGFSPARPEPGRLTLVQPLPLDPDAITTWTMRFEALAAQCGAEYDGWGAAVVR